MDVWDRMSKIDSYGGEENPKEPFVDNDGGKHEAPDNVNSKPIDIDLLVTDKEEDDAPALRFRYMDTGQNSAKTQAMDCPIIKSGDHEYKAYLIGPIKDVSTYVPLMDLLLNMTEQDTLDIYIDSPGGYVSSGGIISSLVDSCKGTARTTATGICASAGALIHSSPREKHHIIVTIFAVLMYHMSSHSDMGNSIGIASRANNQVKYVEECLLRKALEDGHITQDDLQAIKSGRDIFVSAHEFMNGRDSANPDISSHNENAGMYIDENDMEKLNEPDGRVADDSIDTDYFGLDPRELTGDEVPTTESFEIKMTTDDKGRYPMFYSSPKMNPMIMAMLAKKYSQPRLSVVNKDEFRIYMEAGQIFPPGYIASLCQFLDTRTEGQTVTFILGTRMYDSQAHEIGAILSSMQSCKAEIITRAEGYCSITETMIWMFGKTRTTGRYGALSFNIMDIVDRCPAYMQYFNLFLDKAKDEGIITIPEYDAIKTTRHELMVMGSRIN